MEHIPAQLQDQDDRTWIAIGDAARILDVGEGTVRWYTSQGKFQKTGKGPGLRVLLGDVRKYAFHRNPNKRAAGKLAGKALAENKRLAKAEIIQSVHPVEAVESIEPVKMGVFETALSARAELVDLNNRLEILLTRKVELEEVIHAVEIIEQFSRLKPEKGED